MSKFSTQRYPLCPHRRGTYLYLNTRDRNNPTRFGLTKFPQFITILLHLCKLILIQDYELPTNSAWKCTGLLILGPCFLVETPPFHKIVCLNQLLSIVWITYQRQLTGERVYFSLLLQRDGVQHDGTGKAQTGSWLTTVSPHTGSTEGWTGNKVRLCNLKAHPLVEYFF